MGEALIRLGYSVLGCRLDMVHLLRKSEVGAVLAVAEHYDALQDVPWAALFRELDEKFPGSRFILTERNENRWLASARRHFGEKRIPLHHWLYGESVMLGNEEVYLHRYRRHYTDVKQYFSRRSSDLLILDLEADAGWSDICRFLGHDVPDNPFPHVNKSPTKLVGKELLLARIRKTLPTPLRKQIFALRQRIRAAFGKPDPRNRFNNFYENRRERGSWKSGS